MSQGKLILIYSCRRRVSKCIIRDTQVGVRKWWVNSRSYWRRSSEEKKEEKACPTRQEIDHVCFTIGNICISAIDDDGEYQPSQTKIVSSTSVDNMDGPLLIVPDDDDYGDGSDEDEGISLLSLDDPKDSIQMGNTMSSDSKKNENCHMCFTEANLVLQVIDEMGELLAPSPAPATINSSSSTVPVGPRKKLANQRSLKAKLARLKLQSLCPVDSILSTISFDGRSDILTVFTHGFHLLLLGRSLLEIILFVVHPGRAEWPSRPVQDCLTQASDIIGEDRHRTADTEIEILKFNTLSINLVELLWLFD